MESYFEKEVKHGSDKSILSRSEFPLPRAFRTRSRICHSLSCLFGNHFFMCSHWRSNPAVGGSRAVRMEKVDAVTAGLAGPRLKTGKITALGPNSW